MTADVAIHVIEPTLQGEAGHCQSFVTSLCVAAGDYPLCLWVGTNAPRKLASGVRIEHFFFRKIRKIQAFFLYRRLLREPGRIFVATAGRADLSLLDWAARRCIPSGKVFLYFHWFKDSEKKRHQLAAIARRQPNIVILGPTPSVVEVFSACGFTNAQVVPYPITPAKIEEKDHFVSFRHLLFAGAARKDKGFSAVVDLVALLAEQGQSIPVSLQCSAEHYEKYDTATREDMVRLSKISYPPLETVTKTLSSAEYGALFTGGICLQPYDVDDFADRISGVTLDALSAGCPVVTLAGSWMGRVVERFGAGIVLDDADPAKMLAAAQTIINDYRRFRENAQRGGKILQQEMSASHLFEVLTSHGSEGA